ncbi:hypothetical protein MNBD_ACTINO02-1515 [hydrothermal vent metagenome]|uniref:HTH luxR-type domain-containing protein n=1 Tax=hydrothermal vent metagenome TaxID=652676 RepID=A0A3B0RL26_9ZZZZ
MPTHLIGRGDALRRARHLIADLGVAVIAGAAGVGVTAVSDILASEWRSQGGRVIELRGTHGLRRVAFGALAAAVSVEVGGTDTEVVSRAVTAFTGGEGTVLTVVDDAHLLDPETAGVVGGVAQSSGGRLVISVTTGEPQPADITAIWARWPDCRIELEPLTRDEVGEMAVKLLGSALDDPIVDEIFSVTLGYPLYIRAIVAEILDGIENSGDDQSIAAMVLSGSSDRLTSLMERRLIRLSREERRLLDTLAFAESVPTSIVGRLGEAGILSRLESLGLVRVGTSNTQVAHPLIATVTNATLTLEGRRICARHLLEAVDEDTENAAVAAFVRTALSVGIVAEPDLLDVAASLALAWRDFSGAARIAAHAPDDQRLVVSRAQALRFLGEVPDEVPVQLDEGALTEFLSAKSQAMAYGERRFAQAIALLQEGMESLTESIHRNRLATELIILSGLNGDFDALLGAGRSVDDEADSGTRLLAIAVTQLAEGLTLSTTSADVTYAKGRQIVEAMGTTSLLSEQLEMSRVLVDLVEGRFNEARSRLDRSDREVAPGSWLTIESLLSDASLSAVEALRVAESAVAELESFDPLGNLALARGMADLRRAQTRHEAPQEKGFETSVDSAVADVDRMMTQRANAWYAWAIDDPTAGKRLVEVGREATALGQRSWGLSCFIDAVRFGNADDVAAEIEHLAISRGSGLAAMAGRWARAKTRVELWGCARMWLNSGAPTFAIEAAMQAADPADASDCASVQLLAAMGASPLMGDLATFGRALTHRQVEIVVKVLAGASSEEVADTLFVSTRTVENHLHRAYQTLGIHGGRKGLADRFGWLQTSADSSNTADTTSTPVVE